MESWNREETVVLADDGSVLLTDNGIADGTVDRAVNRAGAGEYGIRTVTANHGGSGGEPHLQLL